MPLGNILEVHKQAVFAFFCRVSLALKLRQDRHHIWLKTQET
jgi:hypothetical protein